MTNSVTKQQVMTLLDDTRQAQLGFINGLPESQRSAVGTNRDWSAKDFVSHNTFWEEDVVQHIDDVKQGKPHPDMSDAQKFNDATFAARKDHSWQQVIAALNAVFDRLGEQVTAFSEEEVSDPARFQVEEGRPLWRTIVGTFVLHSFQHLSDFCLKHDGYDRAEQIAKNTITIMSKLADGNHRAEAVYNLGCFYALANEPSKALAPIAESFKLRPSLIDLAKQDTELDSLRDLPEFQALLI